MPTVSYDNEKTEFHITFTKEEFSEGGALASLGKDGEEEKTYTINFKDIAGNDRKKEFKLKVDRKLPTLTVTVTVDISENFDNKKIVTKNGISTYYLKASDKFNINIKSDKVLDLTNVRFKKKDTDEDGIIVNNNVKINNDDDDKEYNITVTVPSSNGSKNLINQLLDFKIFNIKDKFINPNIVTFESSNIINSDNIHIDNVAPYVHLGVDNGGLTEFINPTDSSKPVTITFHSDEEGYIKNKGNINYFSKLNNTGIDFSTNNSLVVKKSNILEFTGNTSDFTWTNNSTYKNTEIIIRDYAGNESTLTLPDFIVDTTPPQIVGDFTLSLNVNGSNKESEYNRVSKDEVTYINRKSKLRLSIEFNEKIKNTFQNSFAVNYNTDNNLAIEKFPAKGKNNTKDTYSVWTKEYYKIAQIEFGVQDEQPNDNTPYVKKISSIDIELVDIAGNKKSENSGITSLSLGNYQLFADVRIPKITVTEFYTLQNTLGSGQAKLADFVERETPLNKKAKALDQVVLKWKTNVRLKITKDGDDNITKPVFKLLNTVNAKYYNFNINYVYDQNKVDKEYEFRLNGVIPEKSDSDPLPEGTYTYEITDIESISGNTIENIQGEQKEYITIDKTCKEISKVKITSDNNINENYVKIGNTIKLEFTVGEKIQTPIITINELQLVTIPWENTKNTKLNFSPEGQGQIWTLTHTWQSNNHDGQLKYTIKYEDEVGNKGDNYTVSSGITIMTTKPEITDAYVTDVEGTKLNHDADNFLKLGAGGDIYIAVEFNRNIYLDQNLWRSEQGIVQGPTNPELVLSNGGIATLVQNNGSLRNSDKTKLYFTYHIRNDPIKNKDGSIDHKIKEIKIEKLKLNNEITSTKYTVGGVYSTQWRYGQDINDAAGNSLFGGKERSIKFQKPLFVKVEIIPFKALISLSQGYDNKSRTAYKINFVDDSVDTEKVSDFLFKNYTTQQDKDKVPAGLYWSEGADEYYDLTSQINNIDLSGGNINKIKIQYDNLSRLEGPIDTSFYIRKTTGLWKDIIIEAANVGISGWWLYDINNNGTKNKKVGVMTLVGYQGEYGVQVYFGSAWADYRTDYGEYNYYARWRIKVPQGAFNDGTVYNNENMKSNYRLGNDPTNEDTDDQGWYETEPLNFYIRPRVNFFKVVGKLGGNGSERTMLRLEISDPNVTSEYCYEGKDLITKGWLEMYWTFDNSGNYRYKSVTASNENIYNNVYITKPYNIIIGDDETPRRNAGTVKVWDIIINATAHNGLKLNTHFYNRIRWAFRVQENTIETNLWKKKDSDVTNVKSHNEFFKIIKDMNGKFIRYEFPPKDESDYNDVSDSMRNYRNIGMNKNPVFSNGINYIFDDWYLVSIDKYANRGDSKTYIDDYNRWTNGKMWYWENWKT